MFRPSHKTQRADQLSADRPSCNHNGPMWLCPSGFVYEVTNCNDYSDDSHTAEEDNCTALGLLAVNMTLPTHTYISLLSAKAAANWIVKSAFG